IFQEFPFSLDGIAECMNTHGSDQDLDTGLVFVVAAPQTVINPQDCIAIGGDMLCRKKLANGFTDDRGTPESTADQDLEAGFTGWAFFHDQANVVYAHGGTVILGA